VSNEKYEIAGYDMQPESYVENKERAFVVYCPKDQKFNPETLTCEPIENPEE
jgi:hypothetical protein